MRALASRIATVAAAGLVLAAPGLAAEPRPIDVGFAFDGPWHRNDEIRAIFETELRDLLEGEFRVRFPPSARLSGDWTGESVRDALRQLTEDEEIDLVIASGAIASHVAARGGPYTKPVFAPFIIDVELQGIPVSGEGSGVRNLNYLTATADLGRIIDVFLEVRPFEQLVLLANQWFLEALPSALPRRTQRTLEERGLTLEVVPVARDVDEVLDLIPSDAEAVLVAPLFHLPPADLDRLISRASSSASCPASRSSVARRSSGACSRG